MADDKGNAFALPSLSSIKESTGDSIYRSEFAHNFSFFNNGIEPRLLDARIADQAWSETLKTATEKVTDAVDHSIDAVSSVVRSSTATAQQEAGKAYSQAQVCYSTACWAAGLLQSNTLEHLRFCPPHVQDVYGIGKAHWEQTEERLLAKVRGERLGPERWTGRAGRRCNRRPDRQLAKLPWRCTAVLAGLLPKATCCSV